MPLVLRNIKNAELTWTEVDGNFLYLENKIDDLEQLVNGNEVVKVTMQTFSTAQQNQALSNIGAVSAEQFTALEDRVEEVESGAYVSYSLQSPSLQEQENLRTNADVYSKQEINDMLQPYIGLSFGLFEHVLTTADLANPIIIFNLPHAPSDKFMEFMFIGSAPVSPTCYVLSGASLQIDQSKFDYELQANRRLIFRYMY